MTIELLRSDLENRKEYQEINRKLINTCRLFGTSEGLEASHYMLDYPWILLHAPIKTTDRVLDAGTGRSVLPIFLASRCELYTVDRRCFVEEWIKEREEQLNIKLRFSCQNLKCTNYESNFFDYIVSCSSLEHNSFDDAKIVFKELERILKPGGLIVFTLITWRKFRTLYGNAKDPIMTCYTDNEIKKLIEDTNLRLLNDENNFDQFENFIVDFCDKYPMYGKRYMSIGVVFQKK